MSTSKVVRFGGATVLALAVATALAHGPGYGMTGAHGGPGWAACGGSHGQTHGHGHGPGCGAAHGAPMSSLLTRDEWIEHRNKMHSVQSYDECKAYVADFNKQLQERAKQQGTPAYGPNESMCDRMRERGMIK